MTETRTCRIEDECPDCGSWVRPHNVCPGHRTCRECGSWWHHNSRCSQTGYLAGYVAVQGRKAEEAVRRAGELVRLFQLYELTGQNIELLEKGIIESAAGHYTPAGVFRLLADWAELVAAALDPNQ
jgi:ribosomal protein L32